MEHDPKVAYAKFIQEIKSHLDHAKLLGMPPMRGKSSSELREEINQHIWAAWDLLSLLARSCAVDQRLQNEVFTDLYVLNKWSIPSKEPVDLIRLAKSTVYQNGAVRSKLYAGFFTLGNMCIFTHPNDGVIDCALWTKFKSQDFRAVPEFESHCSESFHNNRYRFSPYPFDELEYIVSLLAKDI